MTGLEFPAPSVVETPRGRPRDTAREQAILDAALELLAEVGFDRMTVEGIATRAQASKATIYRRWDGKGEIVVEALRCRKHEHAGAIDTGTLRGDVLALLGGMCDRDAENEAAIGVGVITAMRQNAELATMIRAEFYEHGTELARAVLDRAAARGEVAADVDPRPLCEVAPAVMLVHLFFDPASIDAEFQRHLADDVVLPLLTGEAPVAAPPHDFQETP